MTKKRLPETLEITYLPEDWDAAKHAVKTTDLSGDVPGNAYGAKCALAQTLIREVNEGRVFFVGMYSVAVYSSAAAYRRFHDRGLTLGERLRQQDRMRKNGQVQRYHLDETGKAIVRAFDDDENGGRRKPRKPRTVELTTKV